MIPFKGRVVFRQYIPRKPHTTGVKYWAMVDSFGYLYSFEIYIGAKKFKQIRQGAQLASEVIKTLVSQVSIFLKRKSNIYYYFSYLLDHICFLQIIFLEEIMI